MTNTAKSNAMHFGLLAALAIAFFILPTYHSGNLARIMILAVDAAVANSATSLAEVTHLAWRAACAAIKVKANEVVVYGGAFPIRD